MRLYERHLLPCLVDLLMRQKRLDVYRRRTISAARGTVVEIGVGSGRNLSLYGPLVDRVYALDPSPELLTMAKGRLEDALRPVTLLRASAEELPMPDHSVDAIVTTWTLCTIWRSDEGTARNATRAQAEWPAPLCRAWAGA